MSGKTWSVGGLTIIAWERESCKGIGHLEIPYSALREEGSLIGYRTPKRLWRLSWVRGTFLNKDTSFWSTSDECVIARGTRLCGTVLITGSGSRRGGIVQCFFILYTVEEWRQYRLQKHPKPRREPTPGNGSCPLVTYAVNNKVAYSLKCIYQLSAANKLCTIYLKDIHTL